MMEPIIQYLTDNELYKFNQGQIIYRKFPRDTASWVFNCRSKGMLFTSEMVEEIRKQIKYYCSLHFTEEELEYLSSISWFKKDYVNSFLRNWHPSTEEIQISTNSSCGLAIEVKGSWFNTSMYEIPILAIVNEVYHAYRYYSLEELEKEHLKNVDKKVVELKKSTSPFWKGAVFSESGTRYRLSFKSQGATVQKLLEEGVPGFVGTSNVYYARRFGLIPIGSMSSEYIIASIQGHPEYNPAYSNRLALDTWVKEYGALNSGIAVADAVTTDIFLKDFNITVASLFKGLAYEGKEFNIWADRMITHYKLLGIDPKVKTLLDLNNPNFSKAILSYKTFKNKAKLAFAMGSYLVNDCEAEILDISLDLIKANDYPVMKIPDKCEFYMDPEYKSYLDTLLTWRKNFSN